MTPEDVDSMKRCVEKATPEIQMRTATICLELLQEEMISHPEYTETPFYSMFLEHYQQRVAARFSYNDVPPKVEEEINEE